MKASLKNTTNNTYTQPLKLGFGRAVLLSLCNDYHSVLVGRKFKRASPEHNLWAQFKSESLEGLRLISGLKNQNAESCLFRVFEIANDGDWTETLVSETFGLKSGNQFFAEVLNLKLDGSKTFKVWSRITRLEKRFEKEIYLNHLGIFDNAIRLRNYCEYLDATKGDE